MSDHNAGASIPEDVRKQFVAEIMELEAAEANRPAVPKKRSRLPLLAVLCAVFVGLTAWNVVRLLRDPPVFAPALEEEATRFTIYLVAQAVEEYRDSTATLPASLELIRMDEDGIVYAPANSTYTLWATIGGTRVEYRAGEDLTRFRDAYAVLTDGGGS
jgi:hypothetical protein